MACSVYGALGWDPVAFTAFVALLRLLGWFFSMGHLECLRLWGGALVAFTAFVLFRKCCGWTFCGFHSI